MNELITLCLNEKDAKTLAEFPTELCTDAERKVLEWIFAYSSKYSALPPIEKVTARFPHFLPLEREDPEPTAAVFDETIERKSLTKIAYLLNQAERQVTEESEFPTSTISDINKILSIKTKSAMYSSFDRETYFRGEGLKTGFRIIDRATGGVCPGEVFLIVGRLGSKKTTLLQWITKNWWQNKMRILFVSTEALAADIFAKYDAMMCHFNPLSLRTAKDRSDGYGLDADLKAAAAKAKTGGEIIVPNKRITTPSEIAAFAMSANVDVIAVDGMYLLHPSDHRGGQKWEKVAQVSNEIKQLALDMEVPIVATTQIKRGVSGREEYDPEDISYSDALGQDADFICAIKPQKILSNRVELQLIKNRFGITASTVAEVDFEKMNVVDRSVELEEVESDGTRWRKVESL